MTLAAGTKLRGPSTTIGSFSLWRFTEMGTRNPLVRITLMLLYLSPSAAEGGAQPGPGEKTFRLGKYVKGTAAEIRQMLQGPVDEFVEKTQTAKKRAAEREAALAAAKEAAVPRVRQTPAYQRLVTSAAEAERDLEQLRRSGTTRQRLDASTKLNRFRAAMDKMDRDAITGDAEVARQAARLAEERESVARCEQSLEKATVWRDQWVYAIECTFRLDAPVGVGDEGVLTTVKVLEPHGPKHEGVLVEYEAAEQTGLGKEIEGIQTVNVVMKKHRLLLGPDTPGAKGARSGEVLELFRNYRIESATTDADGSVYVAARRPADIDALMTEVMPLRPKDAPDVFKGKAKPVRSGGSTGGGP